MQNKTPLIIRLLSFGKKLVINTYSIVMQKIVRIRYGDKIQLCIGVSKSMKNTGWVSLDTTGKPDIKDSAEYLITIPNASCSVIVASAIFEHLNFSGHGFMRIQKAIKILKLWKTKLKEGGMVYLAVPDGDYIMNGIYKHPKTYWQKNSFDYIGDIFGYMDTKYNIHSIFLNYYSMEYCLKKAGFSRIKKMKDLKVFMMTFNHSAFNKGILNVVAYA